MEIRIRYYEDYLYDHYKDHGIDLNDVILEKDKTASVKYNHTVNLETFLAGQE